MGQPGTKRWAQDPGTLSIHLNITQYYTHPGVIVQHESPSLPRGVPTPSNSSSHVPWLEIRRVRKQPSCRYITQSLERGGRAILRSGTAATRPRCRYSVSLSVGGSCQAMPVLGLSLFNTQSEGAATAEKAVEGNPLEPIPSHNFWHGATFRWSFNLDTLIFSQRSAGLAQIPQLLF